MKGKRKSAKFRENAAKFRESTAYRAMPPSAVAAVFSLPQVLLSVAAAPRPSYTMLLLASGFGKTFVATSDRGRVLGYVAMAYLAVRHTEDAFTLYP